MPERVLPINLNGTNALRPDPPRSILGRDDRRRVRYPEKTQPYCSICALQITGPYGKKILATGWFAGPRTVVTAAHCLDNPALLGGRASHILILPGCDAWTQDGRLVFHRPQILTASATVLARGWRGGTGSEDHDYGAIQLSANEAPIGESLGILPLYCASDEELHQAQLVLSGYPEDHADGGTAGLRWAAQYFCEGQGRQVYSQRLCYDMDSVIGQSGAPVWLKGEGPACVVAIHGYSGDDVNFGVRITAEVAAEINGWMRGV